MQPTVRRVEPGDAEEWLRMRVALWPDSVGYLEGIWVDAACRHRGVGRRPVEAGERWARGQGCTEMASDRLLENEPSGRFHAAVGYREVERIVCFRRDLG